MKCIKYVVSHCGILLSVDQ